MVLAGFKPVAGRREAARVGSIPTRLRQQAQPKEGFLEEAAAYFIAYVDFPEVPNDDRGVKKILDGGRDGALATINGKLISETDISLKNIPGRALTVEGATELLKARIYLAGLRLYLVMIVANKNQLVSPATSSVYEASVERYLGSFKLITKKK